MNLTPIILMAICIQNIYSFESQNATSSEFRLPLCGCTDEKVCHEPFNLLFQFNDELQSIEVISSAKFQNETINTLECNDKLHFTLSEFNFAMLPSGELLHLHSKILFPLSSYCYTRSLSYEESGQFLLNAEVCIDPPKIPLCCDVSQVLSLRSNLALCVNATAPAPTPVIMFDGSPHQWPLAAEVQPLPDCNAGNYTTTFVQLSDGAEGATIHLKKSGLLFRWLPSSDTNYVNLDESNVCIGLISRFPSFVPVAVFCKQKHEEKFSCQADETCHAKCCPDDEVYDLETRTCEHEKFIHTWQPALSSKNLKVIYGMPSCSSYFPLNEDIEGITLFNNGSFYFTSWNKTIEPPRYCFDHFRNESHIIPMALVCFEDENVPLSDPSLGNQLFNPIILILSSVQLMVTLIVMRIVVAPTLSFRTIVKNNATPLEEQPEQPTADHFIALLTSFLVSSSLECLSLGVQQLLIHDLSSTGCKIIGKS